MAHSPASDNAPHLAEL